MRLLIVCALLTCCCNAQDQKDEPQFPKTDEIQLAVTQSERAFEQYKQSVDLEAQVLPGADSTVSKDRELIQNSLVVIEGLKRKPDAFHGLGGLLLMSLLDDASRNAALCSGQGASQIVESLLSKPDTSAAYRLLHLSQTCQDASAHLYTVSESVQALLIRETKAQQLVNEQAMDTLNKCTAAKQKGRPAKE